MTDDAQTTSQPQAPNSSASGPMPDPLDSLDELLAKAKAKRSLDAAGKVAEISGTPAVPEEPVPMGPTPEQIQAQRAEELAAKARLAEAEQARMIAEQRTKMQELKQSPEFQAREQQNQDEKVKSEEQQLARQGHVIHQLEETKV